jgi:ribosomal protein S18 acetylase RimI-like enzyme
LPFGFFNDRAPAIYKKEKADGMEKKTIEIKIVHSWAEDDIVELYQAGGWWKEYYDKSGIPALIAGSFAFAVAVDSTTGKAIGMGRVLSDRISDAYIQDLIVFPQYRRLHVGTKLVRALIDYCQSKGVTWIALIAEPGTDVFYKTLGFKPMEHYVPMILPSER